jgi:hypothetical protein
MAWRLSRHTVDRAHRPDDKCFEPIAQWLAADPAELEQHTSVHGTLTGHAEVRNTVDPFNEEGDGITPSVNPEGPHVLRQRWKVRTWRG